jgi:hypothetical protein
MMSDAEALIANHSIFSTSVVSIAAGESDSEDIARIAALTCTVPGTGTPKWQRDRRWRVMG